MLSKEIPPTSKKLLNWNLKFSDNSTEDKYKKKNAKKYMFNNVKISFFNFVINMILIILNMYYFCQNIEIFSEVNLRNESLIIENINSLKNTSNTDFLENDIFINETFNNHIKNKNLQMDKFLNSQKIFIESTVYCSFYCVFYLTCLILSYKLVNSTYQKIIFILTLSLSSKFFQILTSVLITELNMQNEVIYIIMALQTIYFLWITLKYNIEWLFLVKGFLISIFLDWVSYLTTSTMNHNSIYFLIAINILQLCCCYVSYKIINKNKIIFQLNNMNESLILMDELNQGLLVYDYSESSEKEYFNNTMRRILQNVSDNRKGGFQIHKILSLLKDTPSEYDSNINIENLKSSRMENNFKYFGILEDDMTQLKYKVTFRCIKSQIQFVFTEVSELVKKEVETSIANMRSTYLSKICHEFRNPIASIIELVNSTSVDLNCGLNTTTKLLESMNYIDTLCCKMSQFLSDYITFTKLKFCNTTCITNSLCIVCKHETLCKKCEICQNCEDSKASTFDFSNVINKNITFFDNLQSHENHNKHITFIKEIEPNVHNNFIRTDEKLFKSAIYNILYNSYKLTSTNNVEIVIKSQRSTIEDKLTTCFDIIVKNSLEINQKFMELLNLQENCQSNFELFNNYTSDSDIFHQYFEIYLAYFVIKKLGSKLNITSNQFYSKYSFTIINDKDDINSENKSSLQENSFDLFDSALNFSENNSKLNDSIADDTIIADKTFNILEARKLAASYYIKLKKDNPLSALSSNSFICKKVQENQDKNDLNGIFNSNDNNHSFVNYHSIEPLESEPLEQEQEQNQEQEQELEQESEINLSNENLRNINLLIIDDESLIRETLKRLIRKMYTNQEVTLTIDEAANCFEAIDIVFKNFVNNKFYDCIVIDEYMPYMRGSTFIKLFKQLNYENLFYKVIFLSHTAYDSDEKKRFIKECGADYIISKPTNYKELQEILQKL